MKRINQLIRKTEGIKFVCPRCKAEVEIIQPPKVGMGDYAALKYLYCKDCDLYYTGGVNDKSNDTEKDT